MAGLRVHFVFPAEMVERIDLDAGERGLSRGEWVRQAVEAYWGDRSLPPSPVRAAVEQALGFSEAATALSDHKPSLTSPAPAEQPPVCARCDGYPEGVRCPECGQIGDAPSHSGPKEVYRGPEVEAEWRARTLGQDWPPDREGRIAKIDGILKDASEAMSPVGRSRSSVQAKRDVRPVPKAGEK